MRAVLIVAALVLATFLYVLIETWAEDAKEAALGFDQAVARQAAYAEKAMEPEEAYQKILDDDVMWIFRHIPDEPIQEPVRPVALRRI